MQRIELLRVLVRHDADAPTPERSGTFGSFATY